MPERYEHAPNPLPPNIVPGAMRVRAGQDRSAAGAQSRAEVQLEPTRFKSGHHLGIAPAVHELRWGDVSQRIVRPVVLVVNFLPRRGPSPGLNHLP